MKSVDFKRKEGKHFDALASCQCSGSSPAVLQSCSPVEQTSPS